MNTSSRKNYQLDDITTKKLDDRLIPLLSYIVEHDFVLSIGHSTFEKSLLQGNLMTLFPVIIS